MRQEETERRRGHEGCRAFDRNELDLPLSLIPNLQTGSKAGMLQRELQYVGSGGQREENGDGRQLKILIKRVEEKGSGHTKKMNQSTLLTLTRESSPPLFQDMPEVRSHPLSLLRLSHGARGAGGKEPARSEPSPACLGSEQTPLSGIWLCCLCC